MRTSRILFLFTLLFPILTSSVRAKESSPIEAKITIEESLERRLKSVITQILGNNDVIVIVNAEMNVEEQKKPQNVPAAPQEAALPGVPMKEKIGEAAAVQGIVLDDTRTQIKRMTASIVLDRSVSSSDTEVIKNVTTGLLNLSKERGDSLQIQRMDFHRDEHKTDWHRLTQPPDLFWVMGLCLLALFIFFTTIFFFGSFRLFTREFVKALRSYGDSVQEQIKMTQLQKAREPELAGRGAEEIPDVEPVQNHRNGTTVHATENGTGYAPFSFINEGNIRELKVLLKKEATATIAVISNYLPAALASDVMNSLEPSKQAEVLVQLSKVSEMDPESVIAYDTKLKKQISFVVGGEDRLQSVLENADAATQQSLLATIGKTDAALAARLKKQLFTIGDLAELEGPALAAIVRRVNVRMLANVLRPLPQAAQDKILANLPQGSAAILAEEIKLAKPLPPQRLAQEQKRILDAIRRLSNEGAVVLKK